jgi:para-nitrobenzyl esterase
MKLRTRWTAIASVLAVAVAAGATAATAASAAPKAAAPMAAVPKAVAPKAAAAIVATAQGALKGVTSRDYRVFNGIPYAAPPTGNLR